MVSGRTWHDNPFFIAEWVRMPAKYTATGNI